MARHLTQQRPTAGPRRRTRRIGLVAATAALLTAGAGLSLPSASAGPSDGPAACEEGLVPLSDVTVTVNGAGYEAEWLAEHYQEVAQALEPLDQVEATYDPDDDLATDDVLAEDCSRGFQLEAFGTDGPTFPTSGTQVWADGDGATMSADQPSVALGVSVPECYYQTDFSSQGTTFEPEDYYDGHDAAHPVPRAPDIRTPDNLIAASTGGEGCVSPDVTPQEPEVRPGCSTDGIVVRVVLDEDLAWSYTLDGGTPVAITQQRTTVPVAEDAAYDVVVTAAPVGDATIPEGAETEWTFEGVRDCAAEPPPRVVPTAPTAEIDCEQGALVIGVTPDENLTWSYTLDGGAPVAITGSSAVVPVEEDAAYAVVVTAAPVGDATIPGSTESEWSFDGVLDCADVLPSVTPGPVNAPVRGGTVLPDELAFTGAEPGLAALASVLLLLGGGGLVLLARRRTA